MPNPLVLVIGGGISGITTALNLAQRGIAVELVERETKLGGNALDVCCKAVAGQCQYCGGCLFAERLSAVATEPLITVRTSSTVEHIELEQRAFSYHVASPWDKRLGSAQAVVVATGFDHIDARSKGPYGYGILPMVISGEDLEKRLKAEGQAAFDSAAAREVAFIQCVGSRDEHAGRDWCSQVCCRYGVRLARLLKSRSPQTNITIYKMDIQSTGRDATAYRASLAEGIQYIAGLPAVIRRSETNPAKAAMLFDNIQAGEFQMHEYDLVVLATGIEPRHDAAQLAGMLGVERNRFGFLATGQDGTTMPVPGVFTAGCCQSPRSISESIAHAGQAAEACFRYLQGQAQ